MAWTPGGVASEGIFDTDIFDTDIFDVGAVGGLDDMTDVYASIQSGEAAANHLRFDHAEVYESDDDVILETLTVTRGSRFDGGAEVPGRIDFSVLDPDDVYTPRNTASPLTGLVLPGRPVHIRATYDGRLYPLAYGIVRTITPDPSSKTVSFGCEDGLSELDDYTVSRPFSADVAAYDLRAAVLAVEALAADQHDIATDSIEASRLVDGTDADVSVLDYLDGLNEATGTVHLCAPHVEAIRPWRYRTITRPSLTDDRAGTFITDDFQTLSDVSASDESLITRQRVSWVGYEHRPSQVVVEATETTPYWTYADADYGSSDNPEPEDIFRLRRVRGRKRRSRRRLKKVGRRFVDSVVPIAFTAGESKVITLDFLVPMQDVAVTTTDGGNVTSSLVTEPGRVTITLTASDADTVTGVSVTAMPHIPLNEQEELEESSATREGSPIDSSLLPNGGMAAGLASYITWRYGSGRLRPSVIDQHHPMRQLTTDVGSHVTLTAARWFIDGEDYVVRSVEHSVSGGGLEWQTSYGLEELPAGPRSWFTLDGSPDQGLDSSATLAH